MVRAVAGASRPGAVRARTRLGCALFAALAAAAVPQPAARGEALRDTDVVARVNGVPIYRRTVRDVVRSGLLMQDREPDAEGLARLTAQALDSLIELELLYQESQARGVTVSEADVDAEIRRMRAGFPDEAAFRAALEKNGMTLADLRRDTRKTLTVARWLEADPLRNVQVSPEEIRAFYEQNRQEFRHEAEVRASHILLRVPPGAPPAERAAVRRRAEELRDALRAGADFAALARAHSEDAVTAARGGDRGFFARGEMDPAFEAVAFALAPGETSDVVETRYGYELIRVTGRRDAGVSPLAEVEPLIREVLLKSARQERQAALVADLRRKARIELLAPLQ